MKTQSNNKINITWLLIMVLFAMIIALSQSCCVYQDIQYSIDNWQLDDVTEKEVYKPAYMKIRKADTIRIITK